MNATPLKVLVIEDEPAVQQLLKRLLNKLGYEPTVTSDGAKAMDILTEKADAYSLVVTDLILPNCTGWEFLANIKDNALYAHIKTIVISGVPTSGEEDERLHGLTDRFIPKSDFSISDFEAILNELFPAQGSA